MGQLPQPSGGPEIKDGVGGAIGGAGVGTLLVLLASNLSDDKGYKSWLVIVAPSVAVVINALYDWIKHHIDRRVEEHKTQVALRVAKTTLEAAIANPETPEDDKMWYRADLIKLEKLLVQSDVSRARTYLERRGKVE